MSGSVCSCLYCCRYFRQACAHIFDEPQLWLCSKARHLLPFRYNDMGYQFTLPTKRRFWLHWDNPTFELDPSQFTLHKMSVLNGTDGWLWLDARDVQVSCIVAAPAP